MTSQLWLVRHGQTEWSANGRHTSVTDLDLTDHGRQQADSLAPRLAGVDFASVLVSPRRRAQETARRAGFSHCEVEPDVAEWAYGDYEGLTTPQIHETVPGWTIWTHGAPGGESPEQITERLDRVVARVRAIDGATIVFAHGHSLRALAARWLGLDVVNGRIFELDTSTISVLGFDRGTPVVQRWNS
jgi:broad specificity phosphatase PhoE